MRVKKNFMVKQAILNLIILGLLPAMIYADTNEFTEDDICVDIKYNDEIVPEEKQINMGVSNLLEKIPHDTIGQKV